MWTNCSRWDFIAMSEGITELTRVGSESLTGATVELIKTMQQRAIHRL